MIQLLKCEFMKTRGRYIFLTAIAVTAISIVWGLYGNYNDFSLTNGWMMFLYQMPLVNSIFMPLLSIVVSSRLSDIEHKGLMLKQLSAIAPKGKIYDAKMIYGLFMVLLCNLISWLVTIAFGYIIGFHSNVPIKLYLLYLLFTLTPTAVIYIFQHTLALLFKNQAVTFFAGIIGMFCGLFSMFLPQIPILRKLILWGYYGVLQFVGMFGWEKETRYANAYFEVMKIDWTFFIILIIAGIIIYAIGRNLFCRKEV